MSRIFNLTVRRNDDGSKHLDMQLHGVIDGGWGDADETSSSEFAAALKEHANAKTVDVRVNSVGGSAFGGVAMYNALAAHPGETRGIVEGLAASAASLAVLGCKNVVMGRGSMMMIHSPATIAMGNARDLRKTADVLDKVQEALAGIYTAKTGKTLEDINALLDEETWMTAEEAVAAGFADEVGAEAEPDEDDPSEGNEDEPEDRGARVVWSEFMGVEEVGEAIVYNGVSFPKASLPSQIVAMAKPRATRAAPVLDPVMLDADLGARVRRTAGPALAAVPPPAPQPPITRAELQLRAPELLAALIEEGRAVGVAAERARLQAIDDLNVAGCADLVAAAKYGEKPGDARDLAVAIVKAGKQAGAELLAQRRLESGPLNKVVPGAPDNTAAAAEQRVINAMVAGGNARRGGRSDE